MSVYDCETCKDTGFYGDNGPGVKGNNEYQPCDQCGAESKKKRDEMSWGAWWSEFRKIHLEYGWADPGEEPDESWKEWWEDGETPRFAFLDSVRADDCEPAEEGA